MQGSEVQFDRIQDHEKHDVRRVVSQTGSED